MKPCSKLGLIIILLVGFLLMPALTLADYEEDEELFINNQNIEDDAETTRNDHSQPIGYEIIPYLFLEDMMEVEAQRIAQDVEFITTIRERLFLEEIPNIGFDVSEIVGSLFIDKEIVGHPSRSVGNQENYFHVPVWAMIIGLVMATAFLGYVAVILGRKLGYVIHKKKEGEKASG